MEKNIDITLNGLNIVVDEAIDYINIKKDEINKWQEIHKEIFGENCEEEIILPTINHSKDEYKDIEMKELKKYLENIYQTKDGMEILIKYIEKLEQILEKNCKQNIFTKIKSIKTNCDELIITIQSTISKISSEIIKKEKKEILSSITNKLNFYKDDVVLEYKNSLGIYKTLKNIYDELELFNIEQFGKVKVYVKLRPIETKEDGGYDKFNKIIEIGNKDDKDDEKKIKIKCIGKEKIYGPFKNICSGSNEELFNIIKDNFTWEQIKNKTTILFSYGISGSGKSYTMFNNKIDKGIFFLIFEHNFEESGSSFTISVECIFEHKISDDSNFINVNGVNVNFIPTNLKGEREYLNFDKNDPIDKIIKNITKIRIDKKTIKHTPNNKESSRSHLFIVLKISKKETKDSGYIVLCDSAGRESPIEIAKSYYSEKASPSQIFQGGNVPTHAAYQNIIISKIPPDLLNKCNTYCERYKNNKNLFDLIIGKIGNKDFINIKEISEYIQNIVKEGFFINESLNHIVKYLDRNIKRENICIKDKINTCPVKNYNLHEDSVDTVYTFLEPPTDKNPTDKNPNDPIGIYKIFNELKELSGGKYRFIMIANSRTEEDKCNSIQSTFDFVDKIKST
jgi:hypothetical protein